MHITLKRLQPNLNFEAVNLLRAFDVNRDRIHTIAAKVYARESRGFYDLLAADA